MAKSDWWAKDISDQTGRVIIITGATSGIGKSGAKILAEKNAIVVMAVRNTQKGEQVAEEIRQKYEQADVRVFELDLTSLESVQNFAEKFKSEFNRLDILINNAGVMMSPFGRTKDGFELQMGTNHLGHFALTGHLMPLLKKTPDSRIVATSSMAHQAGNIDFDDVDWENRKYNTNRAYGDSKLANLYFTYELARKLGGEPNGPRVTAAHPGWTKTDLQRHSGMMRFMNFFFGQGPDMGILPSLRAAVDPDAQTGDYFGPSKFMQMHGNPMKVKSNKRSYDIEAARKLWEVSEQKTGVIFN
jgi:NAD(P)-dependent dehydrogenase (short-subunit alcohol dehydrogenase family)